MRNTEDKKPRTDVRKHWTDAKKPRTDVRMLVVLVVGACCLAGCQDSSGFGVKSAGINDIYLDSAPAAINMDSIPGPDGFILQVYLFERPAKAMPVPAKGTLEFILYEGRMSITEIATRQPYLIWTFNEEYLPRYARRGRLGGGYSVNLQWGPDVPRSNTVTLVTRYIPNDGSPPIYSAPLVMSISG